MKTQWIALALTVFALTACQDKGHSEDKSTETKPTATQQAEAKPATALTHPGKESFDTNCARCHADTAKFSDPAQRKMQSLTDLSGQVKRCDAMLETKLFDEDMENITAYLNETYYKFPE